MKGQVLRDVCTIEHGYPIYIMPYTIVQFRRSKARAVASGGDQLEANIQRAVKEVGDIAIFSEFWSKKRASNYIFLLLF